MRRPNGGRVVTVASVAHRRGVLDFDDLQSRKSYIPRGAYAQSKLANLVFALELHRRAERNGWNLHSMAAHPGWARTDIISNGIGGGAPGPKAWLIDQGVFAGGAIGAGWGVALALRGHGAAGEKRRLLRSNRLDETRGAPGPARIFPQAADPEAGARLWALSETLTGVTFN